MPNAMAVQVTIYLNEADQWHHRPLHVEILNYLRKENVYAATAIHAVAGGRGIDVFLAQVVENLDEIGRAHV